MGGILFPPSFGLTGAVTAYVLGASDGVGGVIIPTGAFAILSLIGMYVWKFTRRADRVLLDRIAELEVDRNYNRAGKAYYQRWALSGIEPSEPEPKIQDFYKKEEKDDG